MNERYKITVIGKQTVDGEQDKIEVFTSGDMEITDGKTVITYPEYAENNPNSHTDTTVTLEGGVLSIDRKGEMSSHLLLEKGKRHECLYSTPMGQMFIGIFTDSLSSELDKHGGEIRASYQLDFNRSVVSYNEFYISIKEINL
ncbi:MAG: DUF1934 domain-containing protein [Ruminococcus sp.]|nr:DUF1934 domain-containing protein [Ruminococcus sp.]